MSVAYRVAQIPRRLFRGAAEDPPWSRPALLAIVLLATGLMLIDVTRSGYGNTYYAGGALAASHSWSALFFNAADIGGYVTLDKGPLSDWMMGLSGRLFGFGSFSVMLPNALCGIAAVVVLHDAVRRSLGPQIAAVAALMMALTPVVVLVARYNTPDGLLLLLLLCAAWSLTVAVQSGRRRELLLCAVFMGLAFNTKMLEAYIVLPALGLAFLLAGGGPVRSRLVNLAIAGGVGLLVSFAWFGSMMLVPGSERPYAGDSTGNSWFQLILGGNGLERVTGTGGTFGSDIQGSLLWIFSRHVAGQIAWLLPLAVVGLALGFLTSRGSRRSNPAFAAYVLWSTWALADYAVLSFSAGIRHAYYTSVLAPAVATLAAAVLVTLGRATRTSPLAALALATAVSCTPLLSFVLLAHSGQFVPWLRWVVFTCGALAGAAVLAPHLHARFRGRATMVLAASAATVALLAGPAAYSIATVTRDQTGYDPTAGPGGDSKALPTAIDPAVLSPADSLTLLIPYLSAHRDHARFIVAAIDSRNAAPIALATNKPVITVGGFGGSDPAPTPNQLEQLIHSRQLRYVLLDATSARPRSPGHRVLSAYEWVKRSCSPVPYSEIIPSATKLPTRLRFKAVSKLTLFDCASAPQFIRRPRAVLQPAA